MRQKTLSASAAADRGEYREAAVCDASLEEEP
jgi:hypothetical protein